MAAGKNDAPWRTYQESVAAIFRRLGFHATVEKRLEGARAVHDIDIVVRFDVGGLPVTWIVECKLWKAAVRKEQVMTLAQIALDVGADRALLVSESGFQGGAISAVRNTNITLTSLDELEAVARESIGETAVKSALRDVGGLETALRYLLDEQKFDVPPPPELDETITLMGACLEVTMAATSALAGRFPVRNPTMVGGDPVNWDDSFALAVALEATLAGIRARKDQLEQVLSIKKAPFLDIGVQFLGAIERFLDSGDNVLRSRDDDSDWEGAITAALARMRDIGDLLDPLKVGLRGGPAKAIRSLLQILFDGPYLWLSRPDGTEQEWIATRDQTRQAASLLSAAIVAEQERVQ